MGLKVFTDKIEKLTIHSDQKEPSFIIKRDADEILWVN